MLMSNVTELKKRAEEEEIRTGLSKRTKSNLSNFYLRYMDSRLNSLELLRMRKPEVTFTLEDTVAFRISIRSAFFSSAVPRVSNFIPDSFPHPSNRRRKL